MAIDRGQRVAPSRPGRSALVVARILLAAAGLLAAGAAFAGGFDVVDPAPEATNNRPRFRTDSGSRLGDRGPEVVLGFEVPYSELFFRPEGVRFRAEFDLIMVLYRDDTQIGGDLWNEKADVADYAATRSKTTWIRRSIRIPAEPGSYEAEVIVREPRAGRETRRSWKIEVPDYAAEPLSVSSLYVADFAEGRADSAVVLPPAGWVLSRRYGEPLAALGVVGEVYDPAGGGPVELTWKIFDVQGAELQSGQLMLGSGKRIPFRIHPDFPALWLGDHTFEVALREGANSARRRFPFQIAESPASFATDLGQSLDLVRLIATDDEIRQLKETPSSERKEAWERFWKRRDPTPGTPENEFRDEFFARVRYANEHYSVLGPGWQTDMGRTYIQYGPPDQVETHPYNVDGPPYEVWVYTRLGKQFVFVDYDGFGRFEFYQPGRS